MSELTVGVVGLGLGRHFVDACARSESVRRVVVCDLDADRREEIRDAYPAVAQGYASIEEMLEQEQLDAVCIVTPDHLHRPHATLCLEAGCHVLMTKPLATNLEDGRAIVRAAEGTGKRLMVAHERRFRACYRALKSLLDEGALGEVILVQSNQVSDKRGQFARSPWYASAKTGRSAIVGTGIHDVDMVRFLVGRPIESVGACGNRLGTLAFPRDKTTATVIQFEGGAIGQTAVSYEAHWPRGGRGLDHFLLVATRGIVQGRRVSIDGGPGWVDLPMDANGIQAGCSGSVDAFLEALVQGTPVPVSGRDAYATLAACVAADESAATGRFVVPDSAEF